MIEADDYINLSPSTAQGELCLIRTVLAISVTGVHFFRAQILVELGSQERGNEEILVLILSFFLFSSEMCAYEISLSG